MMKASCIFTVVAMLAWPIASSVIRSSSLRADPVMGTYYCPRENGTTYETKDVEGYTFRILCDRDWPVGWEGINGGTVRDTRSVVSTSLRGCIEQCAADREAGGECTAVAYGANITAALSRGPGNCYLKDQRGRGSLVDNSGQAEVAYLIDEDK